MYKEHPHFKQPQNEESRIWRYLDFTKFVALLESGSIYFTRADQLGDPFEGSYTAKDLQARLSVVDHVPEKYAEAFHGALSATGTFLQKIPKFLGVSCWHMNEHESAAMWSIYLKSSEGVAVQTTYRKLRDSFASISDDVFVGGVRYLDYDTEAVSGAPFSNLLKPFVCKRKSFEHEHEIRAVIARWNPQNADGSQNYDDETFQNGFNIPVDIDSLVERVYVSPTAPAWFGNLVEAVVKRYGVQFGVERSRLAERPIY